MAIADKGPWYAVEVRSVVGMKPKDIRSRLKQRDESFHDDALAIAIARSRINALPAILSQGVSREAFHTGFRNAVRRRGRPSSAGVIDKLLMGAPEAQMPDTGSRAVRLLERVGLHRQAVGLSDVISGTHDKTLPYKLNQMRNIVGVGTCVWIGSIGCTAIAVVTHDLPRTAMAGGIVVTSSAVQLGVRTVRNLAREGAVKRVMESRPG